ncbi:ATP-binding cassette domain-containing protein [Candidatus Peregrinibacteria bacterium]|nr:ATP-binding cassette domain-containing protein [Candidatus Peregrinibacteria bacterium]
MIKLKNISRRFDTGKASTVALEDINLEIKKGEFVAIMGPSGSGKTTLLNIVAGLDSPSEGAVIINHKDISQFNDKRLSQFRNHEIGFIFQEFQLEPFLNLKENVSLPLFFNSKKEVTNKYVDRVIKDVGLSHKSACHINELSGGQKQRVAIARALINKPKIILADEPTGNLDLKTGKNIIELLEKLHKNFNVTLIIASHDQNIAASANRIIQIKDGKIK